MPHEESFNLYLYSETYSNTFYIKHSDVIKINYVSIRFTFKAGLGANQRTKNILSINRINGLMFGGLMQHRLSTYDRLTNGSFMNTIKLKRNK